MIHFIKEGLRIFLKNNHLYNSTMKRTQLNFSVPQAFNKYLKKEGKDHLHFSSLTLLFYCNKTTINRDFHSFVRQLRKLIKLTELDLAFKDYFHKDPYEDLDSIDNHLEIYKILSSHLKYIPQLSRCTIRTNNTISNNGFEVLADGIRHLRNLPSLTMDVNFRSERISKRAIQMFAFAISHLNNLSHLDLEFRGYFPLDPKVHKHLWTSLSRLENLVTLKLHIFRFLRHNRESMQNFFEIFRRMKKLLHLDLDLTSFPEMSPKTTESLLHQVKYLGKLQIPRSLNNERARQVEKNRRGTLFWLEFERTDCIFPMCQTFSFDRREHQSIRQVLTINEGKLRMFEVGFYRNRKTDR